MKINKKTVLLTGIVFLSLAACGNKNDQKPSENPSNQTTSQSIEEPATNETTEANPSSTEDLGSSEELDSNEEAKADSTAPAEDTTDATNQEESLSVHDKDTIDEFVKNMETLENGSAGSSLKADIVFTDFINQAGFLDDKLDEAKEYFKSRSEEVEDMNNFKLSLDAMKAKVDTYKNDEDNFMKEIEASGSEWDPQTSIENFEAFLDI